MSFHGKNACRLFDPRLGRELTFASPKCRDQYIARETRRIMRQADGTSLAPNIERVGFGAQKLSSAPRKVAASKPRHDQWKKVKASSSAPEPDRFIIGTETKESDGKIQRAIMRRK